MGKDSQMTVDAWFDYWITEIKVPTVRFNTVRNYMERYNINIKPYLGSMVISEVKAMHCQNVLNAMAEKYKGSTIEQCRITMCSMFYRAAINGIIPMHTLRHTFATRCIEAGIRPKTLQGILGHANIGITMNLYVHNTEEEKEKEIKKFEEAF